MDQEFKKEWVAALRSGDYKQSSTVLVSPEGYCCLGVGCTLLAKADKLVTVTLLNGIVGFGDSQNDALLPPEAMKLMGVDDSSPKVFVPLGYEGVSSMYHGKTIALSTLNDQRVSFNTIANLIELGL